MYFCCIHLVKPDREESSSAPAPGRGRTCAAVQWKACFMSGTRGILIRGKERLRTPFSGNFQVPLLVARWERDIYSIGSAHDGARHSIGSVTAARPRSAACVSRRASVASVPAAGGHAGARRRWPFMSPASAPSRRPSEATQRGTPTAAPGRSNTQSTAACQGPPLYTTVCIDVYTCCCIHQRV